jgi:elongation factor P
MAALIEAIHVKRKSVFELENVPYACLDSEISTPTARGGQTLVRLKMRNLLTSAVFEKTFKASDKFKEPDLVFVDASYLYSDGEGSHFLDQESFETLTLATGLEIRVPLFVKQGEKVKVATETSEFAGRV